jgi:hypothetical protein
MIAIVLVVCGAVAAWILIDHLIARRDERLQRGSGAWSSQFRAGRTFHSTGFEDTLPPASEPPGREPAGRRFVR